MIVVELEGGVMVKGGREIAEVVGFNIWWVVSGKGEQEEGEDGLLRCRRMCLCLLIRFWRT